MLNAKQKSKVDRMFRKSAFVGMENTKFVEMYKGKLPLGMDIQDVAGYLGVKPPEKKVKKVYEPKKETEKKSDK